MFDIGDHNSFLNVQNWLNEVNTLTTDNPVKLIIANKSDLQEKAVSKSEMEEFSKKTGIQIVECSAKSSYHITYAFEEVSSKLIKRK